MPLYTKKEAAKLLRVSLRTIDSMIERGELEKVVLTHRATRITGRSIKKLVGVPLAAVR